MAHDAIGTPMDVVKQRLQLYSNSKYHGIMHCVRTIAKENGLRAFFASYPTTVLMNVPFNSVHFATYEGLKHFLSDEHGGGVLQHITAGAGAGALAGFVSNPLDVVKTRIQTQGVDGSPRYDSTMHVVRHIWHHEGPKAFLKGTGARVFYFMPSAAICWTTYEGIKRVVV